MLCFTATQRASKPGARSASGFVATKGDLLSSRRGDGYDHSGPLARLDLKGHGPVLDTG